MEEYRITVCAFLHENGKLLTTKRSATKELLPNVWELPGGYVGFEQTETDALRLAVKEKLGIDVFIGDPFFVFSYTHPTKKTHSTEIIYFARLSNPQSTITLNPENHSEYKWVTHSEMRELFVDNDKEFGAADKGFTLLERDGRYVL